jgi:DNA topoisomerase VI subunit A
VAEIDMTEADLKKVDELLLRPYVDRKIRQELNIFKRLKLKAEIESLYHFSTDFLVNDFIPRKIRELEMPPVPVMRLRTQ